MFLRYSSRDGSTIPQGQAQPHDEAAMFPHHHQTPETEAASMSGMSSLSQRPVTDPQLQSMWPCQQPTPRVLPQAPTYQRPSACEFYASFQCRRASCSPHVTASFQPSRVISVVPLSSQYQRPAPVLPVLSDSSSELNQHPRKSTVPLYTGRLPAGLKRLPDDYVSPALEGYLVYPEARPQKVNRKRSQELPKAVSGKVFVQYLKEKRAQKEAEEERKRKRKEEREAKKQAKHGQKVHAEITGGKKKQKANRRNI